MIVTNQQFFLLFLASFGVVGLLTPLMRKIALSKNIVDSPNAPHKSHTKSVPYLGGVGIVIGVTAITFLALEIQNMNTNFYWLTFSILGPAVILGVIGLIDDIRNLSPWPRFLAQTFTALFTAILLIASNNFGNPTGSKLFDAIISVGWIIGICNAINFFDNLDGGAASTIAISSLGLIFLSVYSKQYFISSMSIVILGSMMGFLIWNKSPARIYMGDAGALFLGFLVSVLSIRLHPITDSYIGALFTPILVLAVPILDTSLVVISRLSRGISPFVGGQDHLSHRLQKFGYSKKTTVSLLTLLAMLFTGVALAISFSKFNEAFLIFIGIFIFLITFLCFYQMKFVEK